MDHREIKGFLKGIGMTLIISAAIFYGMILTIRTEHMGEPLTEYEVVEEARNLGMVYITEINDIDFLTKDYIIKMAKSYGMVFVEAVPE